MAEKKTIDNINLNVNTRRKFTIDGDRDKVIYLDVNDIGLVTRLSDSIKKMDELKEEWDKLEAVSVTDDKQVSDNEDEMDEALLKEVTDFSEQFTAVEKKMRDIVDFIFDCEGLCQTVVGSSSIFSPVNGVYKFEQIIDVLTGLYEDSIEKEAKKLNARKVEQKTSKYIRNAK
jgi:hypothetical protein